MPAALPPEWQPTGLRTLWIPKLVRTRPPSSFLTVTLVTNIDFATGTTSRRGHCHMLVLSASSHHPAQLPAHVQTTPPVRTPCLPAHAPSACDVVHIHTPHRHAQSDIKVCYTPSAHILPTDMPLPQPDVDLLPHINVSFFFVLACVYG
ncbi:hypothetical protein PLICRDRAFT_407035 [Plicaturopsis crispa FD-325 SS-3]|nr:hypothetical protein PLICRDRAFT_407035 [Plicaturopsis crispa FD-325 SS-3]